MTVDRIRKALDLARLEQAQPSWQPRSDRPAEREEPAEPHRRAGRTVGRGGVFAHQGVRAAAGPPGAPSHLESGGSAEPAAAAYRMLRTQVLQRMDAHAWRSLAIFSPGSEDGKTTTAINLAVSLAEDRLHTVLLVDFDLKQPSLAASLGLDPEFGVDDALMGRAPLEDCLYHPEGFNRLVVLPARANLSNSSEILAGPRSRELVAELRSR